MTRAEEREQNLAKMREAEAALFASGFSEEQWRHIKEYLAFLTIELQLSLNAIQQGLDPHTGEREKLPSVMEPGKFQTRVAD